MNDIDRILTDDPVIEPSADFTGRVMGQVRQEADTGPDRVSVAAFSARCNHLRSRAGDRRGGTCWQPCSGLADPAIRRRATPRNVLVVGTSGRWQQYGRSRYKPNAAVAQRNAIRITGRGPDAQRRPGRQLGHRSGTAAQAGAQNRAVFDGGEGTDQGAIRAGGPDGSRGLAQERVGVKRPLPLGIDREVQMRRRRPRVAGIPYPSHDVARVDPLAHLDKLLIKMGVVQVQISLPIVQPHGQATEVLFADTANVRPGSGYRCCASRRKDVDAIVRPATGIPFHAERTQDIAGTVIGHREAKRRFGVHAQLEVAATEQLRLQPQDVVIVGTGLEDQASRFELGARHVDAGLAIR